MESEAKLFGHPIHPMLVVFPLGLLGTSVVFDLIALSGGDVVWSLVAFYMIGAGLAAGVLAAIFGLMDFLNIPAGTRADSIGRRHAFGNTAAIALFLAGWLLRYPAPDAPSVTAYALSLGGIVLAIFSAWLGGELVDRLGVGVADGAHLNSPSSLSGRPANEDVRVTPGKAINF